MWINIKDTKIGQVNPFLYKICTITNFLVCYDTYAIGDSICDDYLNILACNYDDGDCCFGIKGVNCMACICKDNYTHHPVITTPASGNCFFKKNQNIPY